MKFKRDDLGKRWIPYTIAACSAVALYLILSHLGALWQGLLAFLRFISPVFWGAIIAYVINQLVVFYQRTVFRRIKRSKAAFRLSVLLGVVTILLVLTLFFVMLIPQLVESISGLISNLNSYAASLGAMLDSADIEFAGFQLDLSALTAYGDTLLRNLVTVLQDNIGNIINTSYTIGRGFVNGIINFILGIYFLLDKERILAVCKRLLHQRLPDERYRQVTGFLKRCSRILTRFIACDLLDGLIVGVVNFIFMTISGMPYAVLISVVVGVANLLPTFGPVFGGVIGALILLLVNPRYVLWFLIFTVILQTIDGYILKPKLYGDTLGISPLWVLVVIIVGERMFGAAGLVLAIPFAAISDFVFRDIVWKRIVWKRPAAGGGSPAPPAEREDTAS